MEVLPVTIPWIPIGVCGESFSQSPEVSCARKNMENILNQRSDASGLLAELEARSTAYARGRMTRHHMAVNTALLSLDSRKLWSEVFMGGGRIIWAQCTKLD